jgi:hypothetical protein
MYLWTNPQLEAIGINAVASDGSRICYRKFVLYTRQTIRSLISAQGSALSPIPFNVMMYDLSRPQHIETHILTMSIHDAEDELQICLNKIAK